MPAFCDRLCCWRRRLRGRRRGFAVVLRPGCVVLSGVRFAGRMRRAHLVVVMLVVGLVAGSCGSDNASDDSSTGSAADTTAETSAVPAAGSEDSPEPDAPSEAAQPDSVAEPVRLGSRFGWCAEIQDVWDAHTAAFAQEADAARMLAAAVDAHDSATDELDRAEAANVLEGAREAYRVARASADALAAVAIGPLLRSAAVDRAEGGDEALDVAYRRAWEAFVSEASPAEVALMQNGDSRWPPGLVHDEITAAVTDTKYALANAQATVAEVEAAVAAAAAAGAVQTDPEQAEPLEEVAAAASDTAAEFSAQAASFSDEAMAARASLRDALVAVHDARDVAAVSDAASAAVVAEQLVRDVTAAAAAWHRVAEQVVDAARAIVAAGAAGVDSLLLDSAKALQSAVEAGLARIDMISNSWRAIPGSRDLDEQPPEQALELAKSAAYHTVLLHSTAHLAFARSLGESCR